MSQENVEKAREFIAAYNRRDFDAAVESFDPEIEWVLPERQSSDSCRGPDEVKRFWKGLDETFDELKLLPQEFVDAGDRVATRLRHYGRGKRSGVELGEVGAKGAHIFHVRDRKVVKRVFYMDRDRALGDIGLDPEGDAE